MPFPHYQFAYQFQPGFLKRVFVEVITEKGWEVVPSAKLM